MLQGHFDKDAAVARDQEKKHLEEIECLKSDLQLKQAEIGELRSYIEEQRIASGQGQAAERELQYATEARKQGENDSSSVDILNNRIQRNGNSLMWTKIAKSIHSHDL